MNTTIIRCPSCDGYGWFDDDMMDDDSTDCDWCDGVGYVYRDANHVDRPIPVDDLRRDDVSQKLEALEAERLREIGYTGEAKKPWQQDVRAGTQGGVNPYESDTQPGTPDTDRSDESPAP
jgi:hypothetical protein